MSLFLVCLTSGLNNKTDAQITLLLLLHYTDESQEAGCLVYVIQYKIGIIANRYSGFVLDIYQIMYSMMWVTTQILFSFAYYWKFKQIEYMLYTLGVFIIS